MKRKIRIVEHSRLSNGDFGFYDERTLTIHILTKEAMYRRVLRHEIAHAHWGRLARMTDILNGILFSPGGRIALAITVIGYFGYLIFLRLEPLIGPSLILGFIFGFIFLFLGSQIFYWAEEARAERFAKMRKSRTKSKRNLVKNDKGPEPHDDKPEINEPVARISDSGSSKS